MYRNAHLSVCYSNVPCTVHIRQVPVIPDDNASLRQIDECYMRPTARASVLPYIWNKRNLRLYIRSSVSRFVSKFSVVRCFVGTHWQPGTRWLNMFPISQSPRLTSLRKETIVKTHDVVYFIFYHVQGK